LNINVLFDHFIPLQVDGHRERIFSTQIQQQGIKVNQCVFLSGHPSYGTADKRLGIGNASCKARN
jgi:hypothetical protein